MASPLVIAVAGLISSTIRPQNESSMSEPGARLIARLSWRSTAFTSSTWR